MVTETWLSDQIPNSLFACSKYYNIYRHDRPDRVGGGVAVFVKDCFRSYVVNVPNCGNLECVAVAVVCGGQKFFLGAVYKPNVLDAHLLEPLKQFVQYLTSKHGRHVILGDFNLPNVDWVKLEAPNVGSQRKFMHLFTKFGYKQLVKCPTRGDNILDLILADDANFVSSVSIGTTFASSDHSILCAELCISTSDNVKSRTCWNNGDYDYICACLLLCDWRSLFSGLTINDMYETFTSVCRDLIEVAVPVKWVGRGSQSRDLKRALSEKRRLHSIHRQARTEVSLENFKAACNRVQSVVQSESSRYEGSLLTDPNIRKFYAYVNGRLRTSHCHSVILEGGEPVSDVRRAELFSNQFNSVFITDNGIPNVLQQRDFNSMLADVIFTEVNVTKAIRNLSCKTSSGDDGLPSIFFKKCCAALVQPLKLIMQCSFETCEVPEVWRSAVVVPIYKSKGDRSDVSNYRPISLTSVACRVMESILKSYLVDHLISNNLISPAQHGFMTSRSTVTNMLHCINEWSSHVDQRGSVDVLYIDIAKAFDTVSHEKLMYKLEKYGISGKFLSWIGAFLRDRTQRVKTGEQYSEYSRVSSGVPQGSVLGPILFLVYINDLTDVLRSCSVSIFADDSKIYFKADNEEDVYRMQSDIDRVLLWCDRWQLSIAVTKCNILHIGRANRKNVFSMGETVIPSVGAVRDLGITVTENLSFTLHISNISKAAFARSNLLLRSFISREQTLLLKAFITYVRPLLEYGTPVWSPYLIGDIVKLERVQRSFTRQLAGMEGLDYAERLERLGLESLELRRIRFDLVEAFKIIKGYSVLRFADFFEFKAGDRTRGHRFQLRLKSVPRLESRKHFFANRVVSIWNGLPSAAVEAANVGQFKSLLSTDYLRQCCKMRL